MSHCFAKIAFTPGVQEVQQRMGSRGTYSRMEDIPGDVNHALSEAEAAFISARTSFYMATVGETGWPYIQHRGGPRGFVRILDEHTIGFADFRGNRQYVTVGNLGHDNRVSMFFMDYPNKTRLKLFGRAEIVDLEQQDLLARLEMGDYRARVERGLVIRIEGFDWNCPQHITERFTMEEIQVMTTPLATRISQLEAELRRNSIPIPLPVPAKE